MTATTTQTVKRITDILRCFTPENPELGVMEISHKTGLHKSTASRLLASLKEEGLVDRNPQNGEYRLGLGLVSLAGFVLEGLNLRDIARKHLQILADITQETINMSILNGNEAINIESIKSPKAIQYAGQLGRKNPLHATSTGKVILAYIPSTERDALLSKDLLAYTPKTIVNRAELEQSLFQISEQGYAIAQEEFNEGLSAIAAPIRDHSGQVIATVSVSGPSYRMSAKEMEKFISPLLEATQAISQELGYFTTK